MKFYPRANEGRRSAHDADIHPKRMQFLRAALKNFGLLQLLFLCLFAYIFGSLYQEGGHTHNLNVAFVDYDGGVIGQAFLDAYKKIQGPEFPTLMQQEASSYPNRPASLVAEVCHARAWGALYIAPGASDRLAKALTSSSAAKDYNVSDSVFYIWNEARYATIVDQAISGNLQTLAVKAVSAWIARAKLPQNISVQDPDLLKVLVAPWELSSINLKPTPQGSRLIYNTIVIILVFIQEFFYLGTINGLYDRFKLFTVLRPRRIIAYRAMISGAYTLVGSLCTTSMIWAFKAGWAVGGTQFVLNWMTLWLFAHVNFLVFDVFTIWLPPPYVPMGMITWVMFNVNSVLLPFELNPGFYRWAYVMPAHEVFQVLTDVWSAGCNPQLRYALPVLFMWEIVGLVGSSVGVFRRCHYAVIAEEKSQMSFQDRLSAAMAYERKRNKEKQAAVVRRGGEPQTAAEEQEEEKVDEEELERTIRDENSKLDEETAKAYKNSQCSVSFPLPFPER